MSLPALTVFSQGLGSVTADSLNTLAFWAPNVAALRTFVGQNGMTGWMQGTTNFNDGGQGFFGWQSNSMAPDDNGATAIQPNGVLGAGRWLRQPITPASIAAGSITYAQLTNASGPGVLGALAAGPITLLSVAQLISLIGASASFPPGFMGEYGGLSAPTGWYICDGSAVSRTTDAALFAVIGTAFGAGDGSTTFNLPDMRGRFGRGYDTTGSRDPGRVFGSTQTSALQSHQHITDTPTVFVGAQTSPFGDTTVSVTRTGFSTAGTGTNHLGLSSDGTSYSGYNPNPAGQINATETRPTNVTVTYIIKR